MIILIVLGIIAAAVGLFCLEAFAIMLISGALHIDVFSWFPAFAWGQAVIVELALSFVQTALGITRYTHRIES